MGAHARFVGRGHELRQIDDAFGGGDRLITLVGAAGIGKTRLARQYAARYGRDCHIYVCDLSAARGPEDVVRAMASALSLRVDLAEGWRGAQDQVAHELGARMDCLAILDGAEPCAAAAAMVVERWMHGARNARFLATSREPMDIASERRVFVGPLPIDDALTLCRMRMTAARDGAPVGAEEATVVEAICRRVECVPLAIELAAARSGVMSMAALLARLQTSFAVLSSTRRDRAAHHESTHAAVEWSWNLLDEAERSALAQCSVFRGGLGISDAEAVLDLAGRPGVRPTIDVLQALINKSMLHRLALDRDAKPRYAMLAIVRELAHQRLVASGAQARAEQRHLAHFLARAEAGGDLTLDLENLLAAHARAGEQPARAARLVGVLGPILVAVACAHLDEGAIATAEAVLQRALELAGPRPHPWLEVHVQGYLGIAAQLAGARERARDHYLAAAELGAQLAASSPELTAFLAHLAAAHAAGGEVARARAGFAACRQRVNDRSHPQLAAVVDLLEGFCELAHSDAAMTRADRWAAHAELGLARARLAASGLDSLELRLARRILASAIADREPRAGALRVGDDETRFALFDAPPVELAGKPVLRALFARLVRARRRTPGRPVAHAALARALWPEQRGDHSVLMNRLRVAVTALRKLGLRQLIVARRGGYLIDPAIPLEVDGVR